MRYEIWWGVFGPIGFAVMIWAVVMAVVLSSCYLGDHSGIPDKADSLPILAYQSPQIGLSSNSNVAATPIVTPTPDKSACEYEVDELKSENDSLRERLVDQQSECASTDGE